MAFYQSATLIRIYQALENSELLYISHEHFTVTGHCPRLGRVLQVILGHAYIYQYEPVNEFYYYGCFWNGTSFLWDKSHITAFVQIRWLQIILELHRKLKPP